MRANINYVNCGLCSSSDSGLFYKFNYRQFGLNDDFVLVKCRRCSHVYNNPRLPTEGLNLLYNNGYYTVDDGIYEGRVWLAPFEDYLSKIKPLEIKLRGKKLLDLGCGMGFLLNICRENGWQVSGVDVSSLAVEFARDKLGLDVTLGRVEDADFGNKKFDLIVALDLLEHVEDPVGFVNRCYSLLEEKGILLIETPNIGSIYKKITGKSWVGFNPYHIHFFSRETLVRLASGSRFEIFDLYTTFNDIFSKRNLWRWFSHQMFLGTLFSKAWRLKNKISPSQPRLDISKISSVSRYLEDNADLTRLTESRNNFIARRLLGDQIVLLLKKNN